MIVAVLLSPDDVVIREMAIPEFSDVINMAVAPPVCLFHEDFLSLIKQVSFVVSPLESELATMANDRPTLVYRQRFP